ncbi:MAG: TdeIII family type II restriction endonuclease [Limisphaerales bacterium]
MALSQKIKSEIVDIIVNCLRKKFAAYKPETINMPFHYRLLGGDRMALFSFIHSLNTTFGKSIFEPVAETLAKVKFPFSETQYDIGNIIAEESQIVIQQILNNLSIGKSSDKSLEIEQIRKVCGKGCPRKIKTANVDLLVKDYEEKIYLFDLKTVKPNLGEFKSYKRTLLEWVAIYLYKQNDAEVSSYIAIPYNPYEPEAYQRWTLKGMLDFGKGAFSW